MGGGIWTGSTASKASNGPLYEAVCNFCDEKLIAMPTHEEAEARVFHWEVKSEFPGERFVATQEFLRQIGCLVEQLKEKGFNARCPTYTFAGILVPKTQAAAARDYLRAAQIEYVRVWVSDDEGRPETYIGKR